MPQSSTFQRPSRGNVTELEQPKDGGKAARRSGNRITT